MIFFHFFRNTDRSFNKDYVEDLEGYLAGENFESPLVETQDKTKVPGSVQIDDSFAEKAAEDENHLGSLTAGDFPSDFSLGNDDDISLNVSRDLLTQDESVAEEEGSAVAGADDIIEISSESLEESEVELVDEVDNVNRVIEISSSGEDPYTSNDEERIRKDEETVIDVDDYASS